MSLIKIFKRNEKGSITLMVLAAMIFVLVVITASYFAISNKSGNQDKKISKIAQQYRASDEDMDQEYRDTLNNASLTIEQAQSTGMFEKTTNTELVDAYGNQIVVPAGFRITEDATDVTQGLVIEDKDGNQFVWIPLGTVYTKADKSESKTITLSRYTFASDGTPTAHGADEIDSYYKELSESSYGNAVAKDLDGFITSANRNYGYYIGRYEAGYSSDTADRTSSSGINETMTCKANQYVYNYVTQSQASNLSSSMYTSSNFTSDLVNSYAWDTAIVFIQEFSEDSKYSLQTVLQKALAKTGKATDGINNDVKCNIYDMAGNCLEWTTETYMLSNGPYVVRGGHCQSGIGYTSYRQRTATVSYDDWSFRPLLYLE